MASWVTHLMIADRVLDILHCNIRVSPNDLSENEQYSTKVLELDRHGFCVGNIAPDCNVENEDWTQFSPSREVTHWMSAERKVASDCDRFYKEYIENRKQDIKTDEEYSFLMGYYSHLITDAEFQRFIRDENRIASVWKRIKEHSELLEKSLGMQENWDSVKVLINNDNRMKDIYSIEAEYLKQNPESGYFTEILNLKTFPDYIDYLPDGAIVRKVNVMGYIPKVEISKYPYIAISKEEYSDFVDRTIKLIVGKFDFLSNGKLL